MSGLLRKGCAVLSMVALLASCQPLPHPFADDRPSASLLRIPDSAGISIAPIEGEPPAAARKLGAAMAGALVQREIPASDRTTSLTSYLLYGRLEAQRSRSGQQTVTAHWRLQDAAGHPVGERTTRLEAPAKAWDNGDEKLIASLAETSAAEIAPLLADGTSASVEAKGAADKTEAAAAQKTEGAGAKIEDAGRTRIVIRPVSGAPGDGATSLANAIALVLKRQDLTVLEDANAKADVILDGEVTVKPVKSDKQHVKILWRVRRGDGAEVGTVGQENDVPKGMLDGPWGDIAYSVAIAGADGLMQVIARAGPEHKS